jgi:hypothetical protein
MPLPLEVKQLTESALSRIEQAYDQQYTEALLAKIHPAFGWPIDPRANRERAMVAILTAEHVLPIWKACFLAESTPDQVLALAREIAAGQANLEQAYEFADHALFMIGSAVDNMDLDVGAYSFQADFAGKAAYCTLQYLIQQYCFTHKIPLHGYRELEPDDLIAPWCEVMITALKAYAGIEADDYGDWSGHYDPAKVQEFWRWWLTEAIAAT